MERASQLDKPLMFEMVYILNSEGGFKVVRLLFFFFPVVIKQAFSNCWDFERDTFWRMLLPYQIRAEICNIAGKLLHTQT